MKTSAAVAALAIGATFEADAFVPGFSRSTGISRSLGVLRRNSQIQMTTPINHKSKQGRKRRDTATQAVTLPAVDQQALRTSGDEPFDYGALPPFTLAEVRGAIPEKCFKKNIWRSLSYVARDVLAVTGLAAGALAINHPLVWPLYWLAQGTMFWALFVVGHDCGHGSFSNNQAFNNLIGHLTHSFILVPYHGWRISHRTHHANHGHVDNDESWTPPTRSLVKKMDTGARLGRFNKWIMLIVYPFYLFLRSPGKTGSHFNPKSSLFVPSEKNEVLTSTACCAAMVAVLAGVGMNFGLLFLTKMYVIPYWINVMWLDVVTYLHHTDKEVPWYRGKAWSYFRGALATRDHDYGIFNDIHHNIGTHMVHHMFPQMPHYHIVEATEAVKPVLGKYFKEPEKSGIFPFHLIKQYFKGTKECIFVEDEGDVVYYKSDPAVLG